jgi:hypothetical protein
MDLCGLVSLNTIVAYKVLLGCSRITLTENRGPIRDWSLKYSKFDLLKFGGA